MQASDRRNAASLEDAKADARRIIERLGGQVINLTGSDDASKQALADASERYTAARSQIEQATTAKQALLARKAPWKGSTTCARPDRDGMDPGPELETLAGQRSAGAVTEDRRVHVRRAAKSRRRHRHPSARPTTTPAVGSRDGRCLRAGTPSRGGSRRWSRARGVWASVLLFDALFSGHARTADTTKASTGVRPRFRQGLDGRATRRRVEAKAAAGTAAADGGGGDWGGGDFGGDCGGCDSGGGLRRLLIRKSSYTFRTDFPAGP